MDHKTSTQVREEARRASGLPVDYRPFVSQADPGTHSQSEYGHGWLPYLKAPSGEMSNHSIIPEENHPGFETRDDALVEGTKLVQGDSALKRGYELDVYPPYWWHSYQSLSTYRSRRQIEDDEWADLRRQASLEVRFHTGATVGLD